MSHRASILVVCTGNICRSPTGEGVLRACAERRGLGDRVEVDSAGTHDYHVGEAPDPRAIEHARRRGYELGTLRARQVRRDDFRKFHYLLAMDRGHLRMLRALAPASGGPLVELFLAESGRWGGEDVPDPYYGGPEGFEDVLDRVEEASERWLDRIEREIGR